MPGAARPRYAQDISRTGLPRAGQRGAGEEQGGLRQQMPSLRGAKRPKQSILSFGGEMDCFASLAMTEDHQAEEPYLFLFTGLRFSINAAMPSERSSSAKVE